MEFCFSSYGFDSGHSHYSIFQGTPDIFTIRCIFSAASLPPGSGATSF